MLFLVPPLRALSRQDIRVVNHEVRLPAPGYQLLPSAETTVQKILLTCITVCSTMTHDSAGLGLSSKSIWFSTTFVSRTWWMTGQRTQHLSDLQQLRSIPNTG